MENKKDYIPRIIDSVLEEDMNVFGGIYLKGVKWCGKSTTAERFAKTTHKLSSNVEIKKFKENFYFDPKIYFNDEDAPILFDEWQIFSEIWDEGRNFIDSSSKEGCKIILTGSALLKAEVEKEKIHHSGFGRYHSLIMRPLSLYESKESSGTVSLLSLFDKDFSMPSKKSDLSLDQLVFSLCRGGWPNSITLKNDKYALKVPGSLIEAVVERNVDDLIDFSGKKKDSRMLMRFLASYAKNDSTFASNSSIIRDIRFLYPNFSENSFYSYKNYLESFFMFEDVESWSPLMKSRVNMSSAPKKEFVDPSLAIAALRLSPEKLEKSPYELGFFFENLVIRDLRIYSMKYGGEVYYYHDRNGLEGDAVLVLEDGRYALIEIKLGEVASFEGAENLRKIKNKIVAFNQEMVNSNQLDKVMNLPSALIVITSAQRGMTKDGVHIVPVGLLKD